MKHIILLFISFFILYTHLFAVNLFQENPKSYKIVSTDSLPSVLTTNRTDLIKSRLKHDAAMKFGTHQLPNNLEEWKRYRDELREKIIQKTGVITNHKLPLNIKETGTLQMNGYAIKNIIFQTRPDVYATANLFIPEGKGPFPGVVHMLGHWNEGKVAASPQGVGHTLALNGYVTLTIDPWGAGERSTIHGKYEYHGANLGASLMNIGESLMGVQISDNMRGVDLLDSLPYVDSDKIGATGASGGGNQTMWLAAIDERVKAAVPVVSVGTFESYVMGNNCICETLADGLKITEEAGILALVAPRALAIYNGQKDSNAAFYPSEMLRSYNNAKPIFKMYGVGDNLSNKIFNLPHGYHPEMRESMLGWLDLHLKGMGTGEPVKEIPFDLLPEEKLMVFPKGERDSNVITTEDYSKRRGKKLRSKFLKKKSFDITHKKEELREILKISEKSELKKVFKYSTVDGWERFAIRTTDKKIIPVLHRSPASDSKEYVLVSNPKGKDEISLDLIETLIESGSGIVAVDLSGTGEALSTASRSFDKLRKLHTVSRAELWLGKTTLGEWVKELNVVIKFLKSRFKADQVYIDGSKEAGLAGLLLSATKGDVNQVTLRNAPVSYLFDERETIDFFSMGIHLPGFLNWGDISLVAALGGVDITFINPTTMSGQKLSNNRLREHKAEFKKMRRITKQPGKTHFINSK